MCQVSLYVRDGGQEELVKENITQLDIVENGVVVRSLFEGETQMKDVTLTQIDFTAGKVFLQK